MGEIATRIAVLGGGPGGYVAAIRAGQLGLDTVLIESEALGGTCLNVGCIPSKALIHAAATFHRAAALARDAPFGVSAGPPRIDLASTTAWKDGITGRLNTGVAALLLRAGIKILRGSGTFLDGTTIRVTTDTGVDTVRAEHVILASGSEPTALPSLPFGDRVITSAQALSLTEVPERLAIVGAGYIGVELGTAFAKLGSRVTLIEAQADVLPLYDRELTRPVADRLAELGVDLRLRILARHLAADGRALVIGADEGPDERIEADLVLVAVGRRPRTAGFGLERLDLAMDGPFVRIDERCATSMRNVWAVGDVTGEPMLAHRAMAQGEMVAEIIAGRRRAFGHPVIPAICFTDPEIVSVGLSPDEAKACGHDTVVGRFPFQANGRALTLGTEEGFVRIVARASDHLVLGIQACGAEVAELAAGFGLAIEMAARLEDIAGTIHAHPTLGEAVHETALRALGHALHI